MKMIIPVIDYLTSIRKFACGLLEVKTLVSLIMMLYSITVSAQTNRTNTTGGSLWFDAGSGWSAGIPTSSSSVTFNNNAKATIQNGEAATIVSFTGGNNNVLTINAGGTLTVNGTFVTHDNTTVNVNGNLIVNGDFDMHDNLTWNITGTVVITGNVDGHDNAHLVVNGSIRIDGNITVNNGATISGTGAVSVGGNCSQGSSTFCGTGPLPISILSFNGESVSNSIRLKWITASEENFDYFNLEKSVDGKTFISIAHIKGNGTTNVQHSYFFEDSFPLIGKNYYRLTSVDFDDHRETFRAISMEYSGEREFNVSPNPSDGFSLSLHFNFSDDNVMQVTMFDNIGHVVGKTQVNATGSISFANPLKTGVYYATCTSRSFTKTVRFLVK
jgi:hypothetical protein